MLETIASLFAVIGGIYAFWRWVTRKSAESLVGQNQQEEQPKTSEVFSLVERFVQIYKSHGIERTQIPRFLGEEGGLSLVDVSTDEKLLQALNEKLLQTTCDSFGVQRDWLDGKDVPIYPYLGHNDDLSSYIDFLLELKKSGVAIQGFAIKRPEDKLQKSIESHGPCDCFFIALLFRVELDHWGDCCQDSIWRYYPLGDQIYWGYERTRMQLKAKTLIAHMLGIYFKGCVMEADEIEAIMEGQIFPGPLMEHRSHVGWYPEDYIFTAAESRSVADSEEALKVRNWYSRKGWREKLEAIIGPIEDNTPLKDGKINPHWHDSRDEMVY
ncbi:hypothetical protein SAMN02745165_02883 [Malonomonas rubra DSM 5091]|uniref:Uncharacterized protein n=1 Tax=Malonomonas rubra DSM 5091 TaxID=1122189 RepID=A0A1M6L5Z1_MALRU|nr:hypothetical protein [Malonomonas rubra]SHJ66615.1 hypothetical protein SAMN02745165_02883 [Malonomonas rubra DSM 5091]